MYSPQRRARRLVQMGHFGEIARSAKQDTPSYKRRREARSDEYLEKPRRPPHPSGRIINVIEGGHYGGTTKSSRKRHLREITHHVFANLTENHIGEREACPVTFTSEDEEGITFPHEDAVVISAIIFNMEVRRILIDSGSSVDILFYDAYQKMGLSENLISPHASSLVGFEGSVVRPMGEIVLPISLGEEPKQKTHMARFLVVNTTHPSYNVILGLPTLNAFRAVISTLCLKIKFPTPSGMGEV
ncbi:UNVERIFIED_CONTAM: hypothetical protein Slati_0021700 [Sesamum latifolium]|uniref:Uncharacterized protein n=1 Tax=Sesamum latifolium TaxID=2727402 RepID=A0AAW2Y6R5_9LAMI